jgi:CRP-like cAMP-binding protein
MTVAAQRNWGEFRLPSTSTPSRAILSGSPFEPLAHRCLPVKVCRKGTWLMTQGDRLDYLFLVQEGRVMLTRMSHSGREAVLDFVTAGNFFGEVALLNGGEAPYNALALERTVLMVIRSVDFSAVLQDNRAAESLLRVMAHRCHNAWEQIEIMGCSCLAERLETVIVKLCRQIGVRTPEGIEIPINQSQLAGMVGVTRESLNRQMRKLRKSGIVRVKKASDRTFLLVLAPEKLFLPSGY